MTDSGRKTPVHDEPEQWPVVGSTYLHRGSWVVHLRQDTIHRPGDDETFDRIVLEDPGAVVVLAVDDEERAVVVRQYRHPAAMRLVELPAGKLDVDGEDPLAAAQRELLEETGLRAADWRHLMTTWASPGITTERHTLYLARGLTEVSHDYEASHEEADMSVDRVPVSALVEGVLDGSIADAPLVTAVLAYEALQRRGRL